MIMKFCPKCEQHKPTIYFAIHRTQKDGLNTYCRECASIMGKNERRKSPNFGKQKTKRAKNRAKVFDVYNVMDDKADRDDRDGE